jgi:hypothetical protein
MILSIIKQYTALDISCFYTSIYSAKDESELHTTKVFHNLLWALP